MGKLNLFGERDNMAKLTKKQQREYKAYRKACQISNVEPVLADFLAGIIPNCVRVWLTA